jgi:hypothetical protein
MLNQDTRMNGKMELLSVINDLMPAGVPNFLDVVKYPKISELIVSHGHAAVLLMVSVLVRDFCGSLNVVRNMNEDQIIEAASMLVSECGNFRLEDYTMMFSMAKKGELVKIMDRIDQQVITSILDEYWKKRNIAGSEAIEGEIKHLDGLGKTVRLLDDMNPQDAKLINTADNLAATIGEMKHKFSDWKNDQK